MSDERKHLCKQLGCDPEGLCDHCFALLTDVLAHPHIEALTDKIEQLRALIGAEEWVFDSGMNDEHCLSCLNLKDQGHLPECAVAAALK